MNDLLPPAVISFLRDRYIAGVADAEALFEQHRADEDAVTGALGQSLAMRDPVVYSNGIDEYRVKIGYRKIRGRGPGAPEKRFGSDGVFQIEVIDSRGNHIRRKALPFQSKMNWRGKNSGLARQASLMERETGAGIVIDYTQSGYRACTALAAVGALGDRRVVQQSGALRPLGQLLGHDFLDCMIGLQGLFYDPDDERFLPASTEAGLHIVTTLVESGSMARR